MAREMKSPYPSVPAALYSSMASSRLRALNIRLICTYSRRATPSTCYKLATIIQKQKSHKRNAYMLEGILNFGISNVRCVVEGWSLHWISCQINNQVRWKFILAVYIQWRGHTLFTAVTRATYRTDTAVSKVVVKVYACTM